MNQQHTTIKGTEIKLNEIHFKPLPAIILSVLLAAFILYFNLPTLSLRFVGWIFNLGIVLLPLITVSKFRKYMIGIYVVLIGYFFIAPILSAPIFNASNYRKLIGEVKSTEFTSLVSPIKLDQVPIVDRVFASSLAEKKLGDDFALGSRVTLGKPTRQMVKGRLYWVTPLLHSGFYKWLTNINDGTPGYIMVSATNPQNIEFVRQINGAPVKLKYQPNAYFNQDLHRHLYLHGFVTKGVGDYTFEIDDNGEPYWTTTVYTHRIGVSGPDAIGLAVVHAGTGKINFYPLERTADGMSDAAIPRWIDRVQPVDFVISQLDWWGQYVHGFWNTKFGKRDVLMVTDGYNIIYGNDDISYFYTGLSSVGSDEGTIGFVLTNTRTKETQLYRMSGATEYAAMQSAQGKVQNYKYTATFPILVNTNGIPTYFITLKDSAGLVKMFAFVSVKDFSLVGVGESIKLARDNYLMSLTTSRVGILPEGSSEKKTIEGTVSRIGSDAKENRTYYYISLVETPDKIYIASTDLSSYLPLTQKGDKLSLVYLETQDKEINLSGFRNISMNE